MGRSSSVAHTRTAFFDTLANGDEANLGLLAALGARTAPAPESLEPCLRRSVNSHRVEEPSQDSQSKPNGRSSASALRTPAWL